MNDTNFKFFELDFFCLLEKVINKEAFSFTRFSDGEVIMMRDQSLSLQGDHVQIDGKVYGNRYTKEDFKDFDPRRHKKSYDLLRAAFKYSHPSYFKGICCKCCEGAEDSKWTLDAKGPLTWSNLWVNSNYRMFLNYMIPALRERDVHLIHHTSAKLDNLPFSIKKSWTVGNNAFVNDHEVVGEIKTYIKENEVMNAVFLFACSTLANLAIHELHMFNKDILYDNSFIDVGSTLNPFIGLGVTRGYLRGAFYNELNSNPISQEILNEEQQASFKVGQHNPLDINKVCIW